MWQVGCGAIFFDTNNNDVGGPSGDNSTNFAGNAAPYLLLEIPDDADVLLEAVFSQAFANDSDVFVPYVDFGTGTEEATGDGSVLNRNGSLGNPFGGLQQASGSNTDNDNTAVLLTGYVNVPADGNYIFQLALG